MFEELMVRDAGRGRRRHIAVVRGVVVAASVLVVLVTGRQAAAWTDWLIFFELNQSAISEEGHRILKNAAKRWEQGDALSIWGVGHADRSPEELANPGLAQDRVEAVKKELVSLGVPAAVISVQSRGSDDPLVPTPIGVGEAQNRRVEFGFRVNRSLPPPR